MAGWGTRKESQVFSMMVGQFSNGGLAHKKRIECFLNDGGWFSNGGLADKKE